MKKALQTCEFPPWTLKQSQHKFNRKQNQDSNHNHISTTTDNLNSNTNKNITIVIPYIQGIGERFKKACHSRGIQVHFKGTNTLKTLLVKLKDKDDKLKKSGVICHFKCPHINCPDAYIGESGRAFRNRIKENLRAPSPIHQQYNRTTHKPRLLQDNRQGGKRDFQKHQGSYVCQGE